VSATVARARGREAQDDNFLEAWLAEDGIEELMRRMLNQHWSSLLQRPNQTFLPPEDDRRSVCKFLLERHDGG
jgi:hypothetical protein